MSEDTQDLQQDELTTLKARADQLGIQYHPSIGVEKLRGKIAEKLEGDSKQGDTAPAGEQEEKAETENQIRLRKRKEASELIRIHVTSMNPNKKDWEGEIFSAGNSVVGTYKKYVPFDVEWHVPRIIYNQIKERQCQIFQSKRDSRGNTVKEGKLIREFNVAVLPPLSEEELKELSQRQAMAAGSTQ